MRHNSYWRTFKNFFIIFMVFWIVVIFGSIKIYSTLKVGEALGFSFNREGLECSAEDYRPDVDVPIYSPPLESVATTLRNATISDNLVPDPLFNELDSSNNPVFYPYNSSTNSVKKTLETDDQGKRYLRVKQLKPAPDIPGSWISQTIDIGNNPYYYSIEYRGDAKANIILERVDSNNKSTYTVLHSLSASRDWQEIEGSFENYSGDAKQIRLSLVARSVGTLDTKNYVLKQLEDGRLREPMISVSFDDGWDSVYNATFPLMRQYGIVSTQFINPLSAATKKPSYMDFKQIDDMARSGHEIATHSLTHCVQTSLNKDQLVYDAERSENIMKQNGFAGGVGFAYPFGVYSPLTQEVREKYHNYIRTSRDGYNDKYMDRSQLLSRTIENDTSTKQVREWVEYAKQHNLWLILVYHNVEEAGEFSVTPDRIASDFQAIRDSGVKTFTIQQALDILDKN